MAKRRKQAKAKDVKKKPSPPRVPVSAMRLFAAEEKARNAMLSAHTSDATKASRTVDGFDNFVSRLGLNNDNTLSGGTYEFNLVTRNRVKLEAAYRGSWIVGRIIDSIPEDMTRSGIAINTNEDDSDIADIRTAISRLKISESLCDNLRWGDLYGGSIAVLQIEGQDMSSPLDLETIGKGQFKGLVVFDRWQIQPLVEQVIDSGPDMGLPKFYDIITNPLMMSPTAQTLRAGQIRVHYSRVIRATGIKLPFFQAITENMWGESKLERLWDRLISFDNVTLSAAQLVDRANLRTVGIEGFREVLAAGGAAKEGLLAQFEMMRLMQVNEGLTLLDKNDTFQSTAYSFSGLADMIIQQAQQLSGASEIPLTRLFGQAPAGLNATGDADIRMYYDSILAKQETKLRGGWDIMLQVLWRSVYGKEAPKDLQFNFVPLWQMSALDKANVAKTQTETIIGAFDTGLISRESSMRELRENSSETGLFSNITDEEINEAEEEPPMPLPAKETESSEEEPVKNLDRRDVTI